MSTTQKPTRDPYVQCDAQIVWYYVVGANGVVFILGLLLLFIRWLFVSMGKDDGKLSRSSILMGRIHSRCAELTSGETTMGRTLHIIAILSNLASVGIYFHFIETYAHLDGGVKFCAEWTHVPTLVADFALNMFFLLYLILKIMGSKNLLRLWLITAVMDLVTIVPNIVMIIHWKQILAFRFFRCLSIMAFPTLLVYLSLLRSRSVIRMFNLVSLLLSVLLTGAGMIHLLENLGDFWIDSRLRDPPLIQNYFHALYFLIITMSTVGYGDYSATTYLGRIFVMIYIVSALGLFTTVIPEFARYLSSQSLHSGQYTIQYAQKHIVVVGHLTHSTVKHFLKDFLHPDRDPDEKNVQILFMGEEEPSLELQALIRRKELIVTYFRGRITNIKDAERVKVLQATSVIVLANKMATNQSNEDWTNIMRVIALKDYAPTVKVIVELLEYESKALIYNIPGWHETSDLNGDQAICFSEIKLGLMAQSCLAPGFSTLLANLISVINVDMEQFAANSWERSYAKGASYELYCVPFSPYFQGMSFVKAVETCIRKLNILLIAVRVSFSDKKESIFINPGENIVIQCGSMKALVIANDEMEAKRVECYCVNCHTDDLVHDTDQVPECSCAYQRESYRMVRQQQLEFVMDTYGNEFSEEFGRIRDHAGTVKAECNGTVISPEPSEPATNTIDTEPASNSHRVDSTGLFHWVPPRTIKDVLLDVRFCTETHKMITSRTFKKHIVVCLFGGKDSPAVGLCNFIMPLRSSNIDVDSLADVVIVGNPNFIAHEWTSIQNFPGIYIVPGSPLNRACLRAVNLVDCSSCVILAAQSNMDENPTMIDKEAVLATLNIKTMSKLSCHANKETYVDSIGDSCNLITELYEESNCQFIDQDDESDAREVFMCQPYATGRMFNHRILDSLMPTTFFNPSALAFLQSMVTGGATGVVEQILAEDMGFLPGVWSEGKSRLRSVICLLSLSAPPLTTVLEGMSKATFIDLFLGALSQYGIICLGLFRLLELTKTSTKTRRFVYTFPAKSEILHRSDLVYCLKPITQEQDKIQSDDVIANNLESCSSL